MSIASQKFSTPATPLRSARPSAGNAPEPEAISPWELVLLNEDKIPLDAIVLVPDKWVMQ